jgi:hypothetical protein
MTVPPAMSRTTPVIHAAASEARKAAAAAPSPGVPSRFSGWNSTQASCWAAGICVTDSRQQLRRQVSMLEV